MPSNFDFSCLSRQQGRQIVRQKYAELLKYKQSRETNTFYKNIFIRFISQIYGDDIRKKLPMSSHWVAFIQPNNLSHIKNRVKGLDCELDVNLDKLDTLFKDMGGYSDKNSTPFVCLYCESTDIPGYSYSTTDAGGMEDSNFIQVPVTVARKNENILGLEFREHVVSYTDSFLRPWSIACGYKGSINLSPNDDDLKSKITIYQLSLECGGKGITDDIQVRNSWEFYDCQPHDISGFKLDYKPSSNITRSCKFSYSKMMYKSYFGEIGTPEPTF
jgi:hypothetical protein